MYAFSLDRLEAINDALYGGCSRIRLTDLFDHDFQLVKNMNVSYSTRYDDDGDDDHSCSDDSDDDHSDG